VIKRAYKSIESDLRSVASHHAGFLIAVSFSLQTKNRHVYDILMEMKDSLEGKFESLNIQSPDHSL